MDQSLEKEGRLILDVPPEVSSPFQSFRTGARTRAVFATRSGIPHRLSRRCDQVLVKLYKGDGLSPGSREYQDYHQHQFPKLEALQSNAFVQKSLEGGRFEGVGPYALMAFVDGVELSSHLENGPMTTAQARQLINDILKNIWVPLWDAGLRFKDCHPGNFVVSPEGRVHMIDTEQMRKDLTELLYRPSTWTQRDAHEKSGLSRLPKLIQRIVTAAGPEASDAAVLRAVRSSLESTDLQRLLSQLGRGGALSTCRTAVDRLVDGLEHAGVLP